MELVFILIQPYYSDFVGLYLGSFVFYFGFSVITRFILIILLIFVLL